MSEEKQNEGLKEGRLLGQDEIDELLGMQEGEGKRPSGWNILTDSSQISYERLPMLEVIFDRLVRLLTTSLRNFTSDNVEVSLKKMTSIRFGDYVESIPLPTLISIVKAKGLSGSALLVADTSLIYSIVDVLLGGRKGEISGDVQDRPFTTIERNLIERLVDVVLADFSQSFEPIAPVEFKGEALESNPRFATIERPVSACILSEIKIDMDDRGGSIELLIPYSTLEPVRDELLQMFTGEKFGEDSIWEQHFGQEIRETTLTLEAILGESALSLDEILSWEKGSQLLLKTKPDSIIPVRCGDTLTLSGKMGKKDGYVAILVEENYIKKGEKT